MNSLNVHGAVDLSSLAAPRRTAAPTARPGIVVDVTDATFDSLVQRSATVPIVVDLWAEWCQPCKTLGPILERLAAEYGGRFQLAKIDVDANPQVAAAFQVQSIPTVVALLGGQAVPLFQGAHPEAQIRQVLDQLLAVAAQNGITGTVGAVDGEPEQAPEPELPPLHSEGQAAIEAGDWAAAEDAYRRALKENPADADAKAALAQVQMLARLDGLDPAAVVAGAREGDLDSQLLAADAELATGQYRAAFDRLIDVVRTGEREPARKRLVEYFDIVGSSHPDVALARRNLAAALY
ncbi:MAG: tetratricopeptide repeat protein [Actinobacteria bacterium]|nr:tetratricopeptide repeat protein [Actinomycetota bacterium]